ncbi:MAG: 50S ribosomal protein L32 [Waddliaceae bacterium]|nr:50S ribosomal protein L32 [Waddliaceae bacterium]MBT3578410.1 50S ribosomal protein L32 [Waddliaceae bacterium]MBT4445262.1 50S ribosomal protein L32 [Waddliaceae bacterium]MBT6929140.1 50S ribosomal protein L32 [Waddliaceae bacterium]MBT7264639.1 50S ribosomal protein L32 [Waddliaceae bacterium]
MAVPRNRVSNAHKNNRRSHHAKKAQSHNQCPKCDSPRMPHRICPSCGDYKGREAVKKEASEE